MTDHILATGTNGFMKIVDDGTGNVELWIKADATVVLPEMPWSYTLNGAMESWRSFSLQGDGLYQLVITLWVEYSQIVIFHLGDTGTTDLAGPSNLSADIFRNAEVGVSRVKSGTTYKTALAYVRDGGVWKPAEAWVRVASIWKRTG